MRLTRADNSVLSDWWFTVDRLMFFGLLAADGRWPGAVARRQSTDRRQI